MERLTQLLNPLYMRLRAGYDGPPCLPRQSGEESTMADHGGLGPRGEALARERLITGGYRLIQTNYACRGGEIDIIASEGGDVVFVEVRTRRSDDFGPPSATIDQLPLI